MNWNKFLDALSQDEQHELEAAIRLRQGGGFAQLDSNEMALVVKGQKMEAIRAVRNRLNVGLIEAKHLVERWKEAP